MANLTVVIDDDLLLRVSKRAREQGTSVNALVRSCLEAYAGREGADMAMRAFIERTAATGARSERDWTREDLHSRVTRFRASDRLSRDELHERDRS